jgi:DNA-directed RNA polymerase subunit RPC12/RpoP
MLLFTYNFQEVCTMPDKMIVCKDCGAEFAFTEGEQAFYKEKGFENEPVRCPECRRTRKNSRRQQGGYDNRY